MNGIDKIIIFAIFVLCYALALSRKVKIAYASLGAGRGCCLSLGT
jgi:hypothetical protein